MAAHLIRNSLDVVIDKDQLNIATHVAILRYFTSIVLSIAFLAIRVLQKDARLVIYTENFFFFNICYVYNSAFCWIFNLIIQGWLFIYLRAIILHFRVK